MAETRSNRPATRAYALLLRGVNVGGRNRLRMAPLAEALRSAGCQAVRTYIQSGNAVFRATPSEAREAAVAAAALATERTGRNVETVLRTGEELERAVLDNPFRDAEGDHRSLHVGFLSLRPAPQRVAALDLNRSLPDKFAVRGREIYLHLPNGAARTRLTNAYFDSILGTVSTFRNWRTVLKLLEMAAEPASHRNGP